MIEGIFVQSGRVKNGMDVDTVLWMRSKKRKEDRRQCPYDEEPWKFSMLAGDA
jgi:hypothetical protein